MASYSRVLFSKISLLISCQLRFPLSICKQYFCLKMTDVLLCDFNKAKEKLTSIGNITNDNKLKLYSYFKQATVGPCNIKKPSSFDFVGKAKWDAWNSLGDLSKEAAMKQYISIVNEFLQSATSFVISEEKQAYDGMLYSIDNNITKITLARPHKKNALTSNMYKDLSLALKRAGENNTVFTVLTGEGDYFCSGNDLNNFLNIKGDVENAAKEGGELLKSFVASFIDFPKPLIAAVNGPAVGISVTCLGLCDIVLSSDKATFSTPFSLLGQTPEGCSSYTFPKIMGHSMANEVLLFNKKLTAHEALKCRLVTDVFPNESFKEDIEKRLTVMADSSYFSMLYTKKLIRDIDREILHKVNAAECARLVERWQSSDCIEAITNFFLKKAKL